MSDRSGARDISESQCDLGADIELPINVQTCAGRRQVLKYGPPAYVGPVVHDVNKRCGERALLNSTVGS